MLKKIKKQKLALLYGGKSGEHEVSLLSAASVLHALDPQKYIIIPIGMDKEGKCFLNDLDDLTSYNQALPVRTVKSKLLPSLLVDGKFVLDDVDVVFTIAHGPLYEDGALQGLLTLANIAYVGSDVLSSAIGMDKDISRRLTSSQGILSARYLSISSYAIDNKIREFAQDVIKQFGFPLFVKPCSMGSSVGISKANNFDELLDAIILAAKYDETVIVEEFIQGREIELAVLENQNLDGLPLVSVAGEICVKHKDGFYSYKAKYLESQDSPVYIPALINSNILLKLQQYARDIFVYLKCKGMARVDFFYNEQTESIYFNEINTLPGFTAISMYPKLWAATGLEYKYLLDKIIELAIAHQQRRLNRLTNYQ